MTMSYTLPERNEIIAKIEEAETHLNYEVRTAIITASTSELVAVANQLEQAVRDMEHLRKSEF